MTRSEIEEFVREEVNPHLRDHGGFITVEDFNEEAKSLKIKMGGGCQGCAMSQKTLRFGIETHLREEFPDLLKVEDVTDHVSGENPYYEQE